MEDTRGPLRAPGGKGILLRVFNIFGDAFDCQAAPADVQWCTVHQAPPALARRSTKSEIFETGIKVIDVLVRLKRGGKAGPFGAAGVLPNMVMAFGQMNEPPGSQFRVGHAALTMAEYFRLRSAEHRGEMMRLGIVAATHRRGGSVLPR